MDMMMIWYGKIHVFVTEEWYRNMLLLLLLLMTL